MSGRRIFRAQPRRSSRIAVVETSQLSDDSTAHNILLYADDEPIVRVAISGSLRDTAALVAMLNEMACWAEEVK